MRCRNPRIRTAAARAFRKAAFFAATLWIMSGALAMSLEKGPAASEAGLHLVPAPLEAHTLPGEFVVDANAYVLVPAGNTGIASTGQYLAALFQETAGVAPAVLAGKKPAAGTRTISLALDKKLKKLGDEGYELRVDETSIRISAFRNAGLFYGVQTLGQLVTAEGRVPCVRISDKPRYAWRGMLLDCCRHFMSVDFIKRYIDLLARHKMNVFHWHLTEDQGWRLEIKRYPRLTEIGAWRDEAGKRYGGFYTQEDVKDIIAYAASRHVTVLPEIEMPGHAVAALAAYPEYSCTGKPISVESNWGIFPDVFCAGKDKTFEFLEGVLDEVCSLFPSTFVHIGGDEVPKHYWKTCPDCQQRIRAEGLKDENELQGYFTNRVEKILQKKGKQIIGWDEILEGGVTQTAVVQSWRGLEGAVEGTRLGNRVIVSPWTGTYFLCPQVKEEVRANFRTLNSLEFVYSVDITPKELTPLQAASVLGGECCMWNEYTWQFEVDPQIFPRLCALSEVLWSPREKRDYGDFSRRMETHYGRLDRLGVDYHRPETRVGEWTSSDLSRLFVQLWWDVTPHIRKDGVYRFSFVQNEGNDNMFIERVALFEDGREIAALRLLNRSQVDMFMKYPLRVTNAKPGAVYTLRASVVGSQDKMHSAGTVWLRYFRDTGVDF